MREIKFRWYSISNKKMFNNFLINCEWIPTYWWNMPTFELMQFTWLKDKNWKEIYEGDILLIWDAIDNNHINPCYHQRNEKVIFHNWCFKITNTYILDWRPEYISWIYEVIGNIYENPNLL